MTNNLSRWTVLVLAGQRPGPDPMASHFGMDWKALVPVSGEPMVTRVVRTLSSVPQIDRIIVLTQAPDALRPAVSDGGSAEIMRSGRGISTSILDVMDRADVHWPVLVTTADHPLLTRDMVEAFLAEATGDVAVAMVERQRLEAAYPGNKRTWLRFADGDWSGCNLFALTSGSARPALLLWAEAEQDRKKAWKLFLHFGPLLALRAITRTIGLAAALEKAGKRLGLTARLVPMRFAEAAIDVDKPSDHALAEQILKRRSDEAQTTAD